MTQTDMYHRFPRTQTIEDVMRQNRVQLTFATTTTDQLKELLTKEYGRLYTMTDVWNSRLYN